MTYLDNVVPLICLESTSQLGYLSMPQSLCWGKIDSESAQFGIVLHWPIDPQYHQREGSPLVHLRDQTEYDCSKLGILTKRLCPQIQEDLSSSRYQMTHILGACFVILCDFNLLPRLAMRVLTLPSGTSTLFVMTAWTVSSWDEALDWDTFAT